MKNILGILLVFLVAASVQAQAPFRRNAFTTNAFPSASLSANTLTLQPLSSATALTLQAASGQSNSPALFSIKNAAGTNLLMLHSDSPFNTFIGISAGSVNRADPVGGLPGTANTFIGYQSGQFNTTGKYLVGVGTHALNANTNGDFNIGIGPNTLLLNKSGSRNVAVGYIALGSVLSTSENVAIGYTAQQFATGSFNTGIGSATLRDTTGQYNSALGYYALNLNTTGNGNAAVGFSSLSRVTTGIGNTALGFYAGFGDIADIANEHSKVDNYCGFIGYQASRSSTAVTNTTALNNAWAIGKNAKVAASNTMNIGGPGADAINLIVTGNVTIVGTTNQVIFGATNTAPVSSAAPTKWISVQVTGDAGVYRLPLYE